MRNKSLLLNLRNILVFVSALALLSGLTVNTAAVHAQPASQAGRRVRLMDGEWHADFRAGGRVRPDTSTMDFEGSFSYDGLATFTVQRGSVVGEWEALVTSLMKFRLPEMDCPSVVSSRGTMSGVVEGDNTRLILRDTGFDGVIVSEGCDANTKQPFRFEHPWKGATPPEKQVSREVSLLWATCEYAFGFPGFSLPQGEDIPILGTGMVRDATGSDDEFYAFRRESLRHTEEAERVMEAINSLHSEAFEFVRNVEEGSGPLDVDTLYDLIRRAEELAQALVRSPECELVEADAYSSVLSGAISYLLQYALDHPERFSAHDLYELVMAGVRTGVFNSRPVYLFGEEQLRSKVLDELDRRLESQAADCIDLVYLGAAAYILGDYDGYVRADADLAALGC